LLAGTGAVPWRGSTNAGAATEQPAVSGPAGDAVVFAATADGSVYAFPAGGCGAGVTACEAPWSSWVGSPITGAPAVSNGRLYVGTEDGRLVAFGLSD
jgi:outer membrane protein assembly factor BamB